MQEGLDTEEAKHRVGALKLLPMGDATGKAAAAAPIKIGSAPAELLESLAPHDRPIASAATAWTNQLFTADDRFADTSRQSESDDAYNCQSLKWKFSTYEMVTTIQGQSRYTELRNSTMRCIDECTDAAILSFNLPLPINDHAEWYASQTETFESFRKPSGQIVDETDFLQQYLKGFEEQLYRGTYELGAHWLDSRIRMVHRDRQGRLWNAIWEERCCLTDQGGFCHAARKVRLCSPYCARARQVVSHFSDLANSTITTGQLIKQETHTAIPIIGGTKIPAAPAELAGSDKFSGIVEMAQTTEVRALDLLDEFFDFGDLLHVKRRTTSSSCHDLSAQHKQPFCPKSQGLPVGLPAGLPDDSYDVMDFSKLEQLFEPHKVAQGHGLHSSIPKGVFSSFSKVAANERMRLRDALGLDMLQAHAAVQKQDLPMNDWCVDSAGGDGPRANDAETYNDATDGTDSGGCSATSTPTVEQPTVCMTSIAVHDPAPNAELYSAKHGLDPFEFNEQCIELYSAASNFGTGNASGVELGVCHMKVSPQSHLLYNTLVCERSMWYGVFIMGQVHAWYFWYSNSVAAQPHRQIQELWLGDDALNSTLVDASWIGQQPVLCKLLLYCACLFGSWYAKQTDGDLQHFHSENDEAQRQSTRSEFVSEAQRLTRLHKMSVLLLRTLSWTVTVYEIVVQMLKFNQDNHFGMSISV